MQSQIDECRRKPEPASERFSEERTFRAHVLNQLEDMGYRPRIERGIHFSEGVRLRWDLGLRTRRPTIACCNLIIEFKVKGGMATLQRALGQCIMYRECRCAEVVVLCLPSDLHVPPLFLEICVRSKISTATEMDVCEKVRGLLGASDRSPPRFVSTQID